MFKATRAMKVKFGTLFSLSLLMLAPLNSSAQVTTSFTYDANGRLLEASRDDGVSNSYTYDDAGNIITADGVSGSGGGGGTGNAPTCSSYSQATGFAGGGWSGILNCSDSDGDPLTVTAVTDPPGATTASIGGNSITFNGLQCGANTVTRTVTDGNGNNVNSSFTITRIYNPYGSPQC